MSDLTPDPQLAAPSLACPPLFSARRQAAFCAQLAQTGNVRLACRAAAISPQTAYRTRRSNADFRLLWDSALVLARAFVEQVLADRAIDGVEEAVYYHGEEIARRRRYDSRLLLAHLARLDRLAEEVETRATADDFDAALAALERGESLRRDPAPAPDVEEDVPLVEAALRWLEVQAEERGLDAAEEWEEDWPDAAEVTLALTPAHAEPVEAPAKTSPDAPVAATCRCGAELSASGQCSMCSPL